MVGCLATGLMNLSRIDDFHGRIDFGLIAILVIFLAQLLQVLFKLFLVLSDELWQVVGNGDVQLVDWASLEVRAGLGKLLELVERVEAEEVEIDFGIGQVVARDVGEGREAFVDVVVLWVLDNLVRDLLLVAEQSLLVVVGREVAVNHLGVIANTHLEGRLKGKLEI